MRAIAIRSGILLAGALAWLGCGASSSTPAPTPAPTGTATTAPTGTSPTEDAGCPAHTVILTRHAERASSTDRDPDLSADGKARADRLATLLAPRAPFARLVATEFKRTQQTLAPLGAKVGKTVEIHPAGDATALSAALVAEAPGSVSVVATHSNVLPQMVKELGAPALDGLTSDGYLPETEYGRVVVVSIPCPPAAVTSTELRSD